MVKSGYGLSHNDLHKENKVYDEHCSPGSLFGTCCQSGLRLVEQLHPFSEGQEAPFLDCLVMSMSLRDLKHMRTHSAVFDLLLLIMRMVSESKVYRISNGSHS